MGTEWEQGHYVYRAGKKTRVKINLLFSQYRSDVSPEVK